MEKKDYGMVILSVSLLASLGLNAMPEANYYCNSTTTKAYCFDLSSSLKTCYTLPDKQKGKICSEGWKELIITPEGIDSVKVFANGKEWNCEVADGKVDSYSKCTSGIYSGYLGELL